MSQSRMQHQITRHNDEYQCHVCGCAWDVTEPESPCDQGMERNRRVGRETLDRLLEELSND